MKKYKVIEYFQWGQLRLEKGQVITIEDHPEHEHMSLVRVYGKNLSQPVSKDAIESMIFLKKIVSY